MWDGQQDDLTLSRIAYGTVPVPSSVRCFLLHISSTTPATDDTQTLHQHPQRHRGNKARRCGISQSRRQLHRVPPHRRKGGVQLSTLSVYADAIARVFSASDTPSPFYRMGRSWIVNLDHVSSVDIQHATLSFDSSNVKSVAMSRNSLKTLRDYMVELYGI